MNGASSGPVPSVDLQVLDRHGSLFATRPSLFHDVATTEKLEWRATNLSELVRTDALGLPIHDRYPLAEAGRAHADLESGTTYRPAAAAVTVISGDERPDTQTIRAEAAAGLTFEVRRIERASSLEETAERYGVAPRQPFKPLVVRRAADDHVLVLLPGPTQLA